MTDETKRTPAPWYAATQNDVLYIIAGHRPNLDNDYPWPEAPRTAIARVYDSGDGSPHDGQANAAFIVRACNSYDSDQATIRALREALERARLWVEAETAKVRGLSVVVSGPGEAMLAQIDAALALAKQNTGGPS